jgi:hypothetical protein
MGRAKEEALAAAPSSALEVCTDISCIVVSKYTGSPSSHMGSLQASRRNLIQVFARTLNQMLANHRALKSAIACSRVTELPAVVN